MVLTEISLSYFEGCIEFPETVVGIKELGVGVPAIRGLEFGILWELIAVGSLGAELARVIPGRLAGADCVAV